MPTRRNLEVSRDFTPSVSMRRSSVRFFMKKFSGWSRTLLLFL